MTQPESIQSNASVVQRHATAGYAIGLHIEFASPRILMMDFPQIWVNIYSHDGLMVSDPTVIWGFRGEGHIRWSDIEDSASCVLSRAAKHGMAFGVTFSTKIGNSHSIASFARHDRELTDSEVRDLQELFIRIHTDTHAGANLKDDVRKMFEDYKLDESITSCI